MSTPPTHDEAFRPAAGYGRRRPRQRPTGDERFEALLRSTERLLGTSQLAELSVGKVAAGAGLSRTSFYFYFASVEEILLALLDDLAESAKRQLRAISWRQSTCPDVAWRDAIDIFVTMVGTNPQLVSAAISARGVHPALEEAWFKAVGDWIDFSSRIIAAGQERGQLATSIDATTVAEAMTYLTQGMVTARIGNFAAGEMRQAQIDRLADLWLRLLCPLDRAATSSVQPQ